MNKKLCKKCGRLRKLGKFGVQSNRPDGKNPYCRDCMKEYRKKYRNSPKGKSVQKSSIKKYKEKIKDKIKEYNKLYYIKNKERILYNWRCRKFTECVNIFDDFSEKNTQKKINKDKPVYKEIVINPKRKESDDLL